MFRFAYAPLGCIWRVNCCRTLSIVTTGFLRSTVKGPWRWSKPEGCVLFGRRWKESCAWRSSALAFARGCARDCPVCNHCYLKCQDSAVSSAFRRPVGSPLSPRRFQTCPTPRKRTHQSLFLRLSTGHLNSSNHRWTSFD